MTSIKEKAEHVRNAKQTRNHTCHWPGCTKQVPPAMWGCGTHWYMLPAWLRVKVWRAYMPGQENDVRKVSEAYEQVAHEVQEWIKANR